MAIESGSRSKRTSITVIAACQVAAMSLWFSASAVLPALTAEFALSQFTQSALTSAVQLGFVIGCVASAVLGLPDRVDPRRYFAVAAAVAALANALLLAVNPASWTALLLRGITGLCMAGVYPVGMKLAATWAKGDMGLMVGILVGALTLGWSGFGGGKLAKLAQHNVVVHSNNMQMVEDVHMVVGHLIYSALRDRLASETGL